MKISLILATFAVIFIKESPAIPIEEKIVNSHIDQLGIFKSIDKLRDKVKSEELILCYKGLSSSTTEKVRNDNTNDIYDDQRDFVKRIFDEQRTMVEAATQFMVNEVNESLNKLDDEIATIIKNMYEKFLKTCESLLNDVEEAEQKAVSDGKNTDLCKNYKDSFLELPSHFLDELQVKYGTIVENERGSLEQIKSNVANAVDSIENKFNGCYSLGCLETVMVEIMENLIPLPSYIRVLGEQMVDALEDGGSEVESDAKRYLSEAKVDAVSRSDKAIFCYEGLLMW